MLWFSIKMMSR